jgi:dimethylhistidine N-methyltransferase
MLVRATAIISGSTFACDAREGLSLRRQKRLPCKYLYDDLGSALFEAISQLPEYGLTRADDRLLQRYSHEIVERLPGPVSVAELGSGSATKTRWLLQALSRRQRLFYYPIEISASALARCERELGDIDSISIVGFQREYLEGLLEITAQRENAHRLLVLFLGSSIGNFDPPGAVKFLSEVRQMLRPSDSLLLGVDLEKPVEQLIQAYDDPLGVTAAFNLNLLARMNRELKAEFDLKEFAHEVRIGPDDRSVEMHIRSNRRQVVPVPAAETVVNFLEGESIWTETSHRYSPGEIFQMARDSGFRCEASWTDEEWPFSENLFVVE